MSPIRRPSPATAPSTMLALAAVLLTAAASVRAAPVPDPDAAMLTIPQAVTIAEVTQRGTLYGLKRETAGGEVVYHVKVSTPDRGIVEAHIQAYGGRIQTLREREH